MVADLRALLRARPMLALTWEAQLHELLASSRRCDDLRRHDAPLDERLAAFHRREEARAALRSWLDPAADRSPRPPSTV